MDIPPELLAALQAIKGFDEIPFKAIHQLGEQVTSIRFNPNKKVNTIPDVAGWQYSIFNIRSDKVPWCDEGFYLAERPSFTLDPLFHAGAYYVQEASSMFLAHAMKQSCDLTADLRVLDLCAAPGGKSTLIQSLISENSLLISNEVIKSRASILEENMTKWGTSNVIVTNNDPRDFQRLEDYFDLIVVDAPCSGSGLFRKDPSAMEEWSEQHVQLCGQRQQRIIADVLPSLKPGAVLIYSTCSYSKQEDEDICDWMKTELGLENLPLAIDPEWKIVETTSEITGSTGYRFFPDQVKGEGFFIAVFRKKRNDAQEHPVKRQTKKLNLLPQKETAAATAWLIDPDRLFYFIQNAELLALPERLSADLAIIQSSLYIKKAGVILGNVIRDELIPAHELALSTLLHPVVKRREVDLETARQYLRKENIELPGTATGWSVITYLGFPLGWVKVLPNRVNNYYPSAWRILNK